MTQKEVCAWLARASLTPNRALGQNFLIDEKAISAMLCAVDSTLPVLEIGPGLGALTEGLLQRAPRVAAVEIDAGMVRVLQERFGDALKLYHMDFLRADLAEIAAYLGTPLCVVGNLPYYVTTPICMRLLQSEPLPRQMLLMVQKEAAQRFFAKPGERVYGPLTILAQAYYDVSSVMTLSAQSYYPHPDVDSTVVRLVRSDRARTALLAPLVQQCFTMRRKTLANNLKGYPGALSALAACDILPSLRAEALIPAQFCALAEKLTALS